MWFGNKVIMDTFENDWDSLWYKFSGLGMQFMYPYNLNFSSHLMEINSMFKSGSIVIHRNCNELIDHIRHLSFNKGKVEEKYLFGLSFILLIAGMTSKYYNQEVTI